MINNIGAINFSPNANTISPFSGVGKEAVGLESGEAKADLFAPIEESPQDEKAQNDDASIEQRVNGDEQEGEEEPDGGSQRANQKLDESDLNEIRELRARDVEVRAHEAAHAGVGGQYAGASSYSYQTGPNGVKYAVGGEVSISLPSGSGDPQQVINAANQVRRAALAPANPSGQDRSVAASATQLAVSARADLRELQADERRLSAASSGEAKAERELKEEQRKSRIESVRSGSLLSNNLSTPESLSDSNAPGQLFNQTA